MDPALEQKPLWSLFEIEPAAIALIVQMQIPISFGPIVHSLKAVSAKGSFTNYVYKKRWVGSPKMSTFIR